MKKYFFFVSGLLMSGLLIAPLATYAAGKRRYIKRQHGVKLHWDLPSYQLAPEGSSDAQTSLLAAYGYNWKGRVEVGPYVGLSANLKAPANSIQNYSAGLFVEYNFIKNRGRWKTIPALQLALGVEKSEDSTYPFKTAIGLYPSVKFFVGKRTPLTLLVGYKALLKGLTHQGMSHNIVASAGFSYYFDFN